MKPIRPFLLKLSTLSLLTFLAFVLIQASSTNLPSFTDSNSAILSKHTFPLKMDFASEIVPIDDPDVYERLDREMVVNINYHSNTTLVIKRANKLFPIIEPILKKNNIPDDFKYLAVIESSLTNAVSPAGAKGVWQFLSSTAKEKGLEIRKEVDQRYHLKKATQAACDYLLEAKEKFGNWTLAAAAYNAGINGIEKQLDTQKVTNYYHLLLNQETSRYVFRILALKEIMKNPKIYHFDIPKNQLYQREKTKEITINKSISNLAEFALSKNINYKTLKRHNPWLRKNSLTINPGKSYQITLPIK